MKMSVFLTGAVFATLLAFASLVAVIVYLDPSSGDWLTMVLFYSSVFISTAGFLSLIGLIARRLSRKSRLILSINRQLRDSFRQGVLLAIILVVTLILQSRSLVNWQSLAILIGAVGLTEFLMSRYA